MSTKFTPGPWTVTWSNTSGLNQYDVESSDGLICSIQNDGNPMNAFTLKFNAQLIAAAPEMFEMLKKMSGYANFLDGMYGANSDEKRDFLDLLSKIENK